MKTTNINTKSFQNGNFNAQKLSQTEFFPQYLRKMDSTTFSS
jgi:hypothetical protein